MRIEADADAVLAVGAPAFAEALARLAALAYLWQERIARTVGERQLQFAEPPVAFRE
jgi:hypothetical protein